MSRLLRTIAILLFVASCGNRDFEAPSNLDDACVIVKERPKYLRAMQETEQNWQVPVPMQMAVIYQESKFIGNNRTPMKYLLGIIPMGRQSSAYGYAQALDGTWDDYKDARGGWLAKRDNIYHATDFIGWYMAHSSEKLGIPRSDVRNQYLAYHEGWSGYRRGTHNRKSWLLRIAGEIEARAILYETQLRSCGKL
ncbi:MAG: lytic transglycosylase [Maritimibacter sp.]|jgi:hypothetical protein